MVKTGFRAAVGSWKIMAMPRPRTWRRARWLIFSTSWPLKRMEPPRIWAGGMGSTRSTAFTVLVLPQPVSPTRPTFSPGCTCSSTPLSTFSAPP